MYDTKTLKEELWEAIQAFDLDQPMSEYGFSTRLAKENCWTQSFTQKAILEYKKFMYLAATSEAMVSPSAIVDVVWHQHLIFTQSYHEFCTVLGKRIEHVPSTHNQDDAIRFKQAKDRTVQLYENAFGKQPEAMWDYASIYGPLQLQKSFIKLRSILLIAANTFLILAVPAYFILRPYYININSNTFLISYLTLIIFAFAVLELYNRKRLARQVSSWNKAAFVFELTPAELVYVANGKLSGVIDSYVDQMIASQQVLVQPDQKLSIPEKVEIKTPQEFVIIETIRKYRAVHYPTLLNRLLVKPVFRNVSDSMSAFSKYVYKSKWFSGLFSLNILVLLTVFLLGFTRLALGIAREKPVALIAILLFIYLIAMTFFIYRTTYQLLHFTLPKLYREIILSKVGRGRDKKWNYFLLGPSAFSATFLPVMNYGSRTDNASSGSSCSSSCGSSCGSSCSSCGGCGGD